jgi:hypothetical protein
MRWRPRQYEGVRYGAGAPAENIALPIDFDIRKSHAAKPGSHVSCSHAFMESGGGNLRDGDLGIEGALIFGFDQGESLLHVGAVGERAVC